MKKYKLNNGLNYVEMLNELNSISAFAEDKTYFKFGWGTTPDEGYKLGKKISREEEWKGGSFYQDAVKAFNWKDS